MKPLAIFGMLLFIASVAVSGWLCRWTYFSFYPPTPHVYSVEDIPIALAAVQKIYEHAAKPWRPWARLAFSAIMIVGMFSVSIFVISKTAPHCDN